MVFQEVVQGSREFQKYFKGVSRRLRAFQVVSKGLPGFSKRLIGVSGVIQLIYSGF